MFTLTKNTTKLVVVVVVVTINQKRPLCTLLAVIEFLNFQNFFFAPLNVISLLNKNFVKKKNT